MLIVTKFLFFCFLYMCIRSCTCYSNGITFKIFNGTDAHQYEKHLVQVEIKGKQNAFTGADHVCGGVILREDMVATASYCVYNDKGPLEPRMITVIAGSPYLYTRTPNAQVRVVNDLSIHQNYKYGEDAYGIAVLKFKEPLVEDGTTVQHLDALDKALRVSDYCVILGWGNVDCYKRKGSSKPNILQHTTLRVLSNARCEELAGKKLAPKIICAQDECGDAHPCAGDTGSPLICHDQLAGILLNGHDSTEKPSIFNSLQGFHFDLYMIRYVSRDLKMQLKSGVARVMTRITLSYFIGFCIISLYFLQ